MSNLHGVRPDVVRPGEWLSVEAKFVVALVAVSTCAFLSPWLGLAVAAVGAVVLKGRARITLATLAVLLVADVVFLTTIFS